MYDSSDGPWDMSTQIIYAIKEDKWSEFLQELHELAYIYADLGDEE